jgi:hypothetical protein
MAEDTTHTPSPSPSKRLADDCSSGSEGTSMKKHRMRNAGSGVSGAQLGMPGESNGHSGPSAGIPGGSSGLKKSGLGHGVANNKRALLGEEESGGHQSGPSTGEPSSGPSTRSHGRQGGPGLSSSLGPSSGPSTRNHG